MVPIAIEPESSDRRVLRHQLLDLLFHKVKVVVIVRVVTLTAGVSSRLSDREILPDPVKDGIVELEAEPLFVAGVSEILDHILSPRGGLDDVVVRSLRVKHRKAVVMTGGDRHIAGSGVLECLYPLLGVVAGRIESRGRMGIFILVQATKIKVPLPLRVRGIYSPMQEYSEAVVDEPPAGLKILRRRLVVVL